MPFFSDNINNLCQQQKKKIRQKKKIKICVFQHPLKLFVTIFSCISLCVSEFVCVFNHSISYIFLMGIPLKQIFFMLISNCQLRISFQDTSVWVFFSFILLYMSYYAHTRTHTYTYRERHQKCWVEGCGDYHCYLPKWNHILYTLLHVSILN